MSEQTATPRIDCEGTPMLTSTADAVRALYVTLDDKVQDVARRKASRRAHIIRYATCFIVRLTPEQIDAIAVEYAHKLFTAILDSEQLRAFAIVDAAAETL